MEYKNWIFDWSGTIVDDMALVVDATNHVMRQYEKSIFDRESFRDSFYLPYEGWYKEVLPGIDLAEIEDHFRAGFDTSTAGVPVLPYARELLELLNQRGDRMFVCTSMDPTAFVKQAELHGLSDFFEHTYAGVLNKCDLISQILEEHSLAKNQTVFVGDMIHDIDAGHHGGIETLAVLTGYNNRKELESAKPTRILQDFSPLLVS